MIIFDLRCLPAGHVFEAWFGSSVDYASQQARGLVACPICGAAKIEKAPMAPAIGKKGASSVEAATSDLVSADPAAVKQMLGVLAAMQKAILEKSDWVGDRFASEARAIHLGDIGVRAIHGRATRADAESLVEDGVMIAPLLFPIAPPGEEN